MKRKYLKQIDRDLVWNRAQFMCEYCLAIFGLYPGVFTIDHIIALAEGGLDDTSNMALCCNRCNVQKWKFIKALDPLSGKTISLYNPRKDRWTEHFEWDTDLATLIGKTPTGRVTITTLQLNQPRVVRYRMLCIGEGHPPTPPNG